MRRIAHPIALIAALGIALSSLSAAVARVEHRPGPGTFVTICVGHTVKVIELGPDGQPIDRAPFCPDCVFCHVAILTDIASPNRTPQAERRASLTPTPSLPGPQRRRWSAPARGPPRLA